MRFSDKGDEDAPPEDVRELLAFRMSELSEEYVCAEWECDTEFKLWKMLQGGPRAWGFGDVTQDEIDELRALSERAGGWCTWRWGEDRADGRADGRVVFVPLAEWLEIFEKGKC